MGNIKLILVNLLHSIYRLIINRKVWSYSSFGYCFTCGKENIFVYSKDIENFLTNIINNWCKSPTYVKKLLERENYLCTSCLANYRMRVHANTVIRLMGLSKTTDLIRIFKINKTLTLYETSNYNIFRIPFLKKTKNYFVSEYFDHVPHGNIVNGIRNENLEHLTFADNSFDYVINSDVLEHVSDLNKALSEIRRVLKPGGFHVFTIPVDHELETTTERAIIKNGKITHLMEPVMHGDTIRNSGILAFRDFGGNVLNYISREGFESKEYKYYNNDHYITSVYYAEKKY